MHKTPEARAEYRRRYREEHGDEIREKERTKRKRRREDALAAYGGKCACCGETDPVFLTFDHIDGNGGGRDRGRVPGRANAGHLFYYRLLREHDPNIRVLCFNCNYAEHHGGCPHARH